MRRRRVVRFDRLAALAFELLQHGVEVVAQAIDRALVRGEFAVQRVDRVFEHRDLALEFDQAIAHVPIMAPGRARANGVFAGTTPVARGCAL